jgi:hypothetical protein
LWRGRRHAVTWKEATTGEDAAAAAAWVIEEEDS